LKPILACLETAKDIISHRERISSCADIVSDHWLGGRVVIETSSEPAFLD
jgi:hypothetical protein